MAYKLPVVESTEAKQQREKFRRALIDAGIECEHVSAEDSQDGETGFLELHGTRRFLEKQAEALRIRMPLRVIISDGKSRTPTKRDHRFTAVFDRRRFEKVADDDLFTGAQRSRMVWERIKIKGIRRLIDRGIYDAAFPPHEELDMKAPLAEKPRSDRQMLYDKWAKMRMFSKEQPIPLIRKYFGEKITIYFAWLGFYTRALIPLSIFGFLCMVFGLFYGDIPTEELCDSSPSGLGSTEMCPNGQMSLASIWLLSKNCILSKVSHVFDNWASVAFAVVISIWSTIYLKSWKRRETELALDLGVEELDETASQTHARPLKSLAIMGSMAGTLLALMVVVIFVGSVYMYGFAVRTVLEKSGVHGTLVVAVVNVTIMAIFDYGYRILAWYMTWYECPETNERFEESYALKVFLFQFINHYSSLIYVAFLKGRFTSVVDLGKSSFTESADMCDPAGCMAELSKALAAAQMAVKQFFHICVEMLYPMLLNEWRKWRRTRKGSTAPKTVTTRTRWEQDYQLNKVPGMESTFNEYLEMVVQYGFFTLFASAFPLAPMFALANNVMEIRLDAYKFLVLFRRPVAFPARDVGVWHRIMYGIDLLAVLTNACIIGFTGDLIPRLLYQYVHGTLAGYVENTLTWYDTRPVCVNQSIYDQWSVCNRTYCRFHDYRLPPCSLRDLNVSMTECDEQNQYSHTLTWWHVLGARLVFVYVFVNLVFSIKGVVSMVVPDVTAEVAAKMQRELYHEQDICEQGDCVIPGKSDTEKDGEMVFHISVRPRPDDDNADEEEDEDETNGRENGQIELREDVRGEAMRIERCLLPTRID